MSDNETVVTTPTNDIVLRYQFEAYMKCRDESINLIGEGFTAFPEAKNAQEYSRKYINYKTEKTDVIGYSPSIAYNCDSIPDDPVVEDIMYITDHELVGSATHREIICVNRWDESDVYTLTSDVAIAAGKTYYTKEGSVYTPVAEPSVGSIGSYYEKSGVCAAYKRTYAVIPDTKGDGTEALVYSGTMKAVSDIVFGTFAPATKTFTPAS